MFIEVYEVIINVNKFKAKQQEHCVSLHLTDKCSGELNSNLMFTSCFSSDSESVDRENIPEERMYSDYPQQRHQQVLTHLYSVGPHKDRK